ncbi:hypothetical protein MBLNU230_g7909t1 [Neophaeotheca triangularis]
MTTAHRPTFDPARGKEAARGEAYHQRLLPAHKTLKYRQANQGTPQEQAKRDLKAELLRNERRHFASKEGRAIEDDDEEDGVSGGAAAGKETLLIEGEGGVKRKASDVGNEEGKDAGGEVEGDEDYQTKKRRIEEQFRKEDQDSDGSSSESSDSDSDSDDEDESAALQRELMRIKAERAEAAEKEAEVQRKKDEEAREKDIALGNPLLNPKKYGVKRRWDEDVVFKNQARGTEEKGKDKRFVNDLLRSDFHRKFMDKYVR